MLFLVAAALAVLLAAFTHVANDFGPLDLYAPPTPHAADWGAQLFSGSYYEARALFRQQAKAAHATLVTRPLPGFELENLTIDFALLPGARDRVVVHVSGTHGVEGFAGSAIQSAVLKGIAAATSDSDQQDDDPNGPTVIFVHALNAYGFAKVSELYGVVW